MATKDDPFRSELKTYIFGLSVACPYNGDNPHDCPLCDIRKKKLADRYKWVDQLSAEEMMTIKSNHHQCLHDKQKHMFEGKPVTKPEGI